MPTPLPLVPCQLIIDYNSNPTTTSLTIEEQNSVQFPAITVCNTNVLNYGGLRSNVTSGLESLEGIERDASGNIDLYVWHDDHALSTTTA